MLSFHFLQDQKVNYNLKKLNIGRIKGNGRISEIRRMDSIFLIMIRKSEFSVFESPLICRINQNKSYFLSPLFSSVVFTGHQAEQ